MKKGFALSSRHMAAGITVSSCHPICPPDAGSVVENPLNKKEEI